MLPINCVEVKKLIDVGFVVGIHVKITVLAQLGVCVIVNGKLYGFELIPI